MRASRSAEAPPVGAPRVPWTAVPTLWTIGYERLIPDELVAELKVAGVERLIDVRYRPQSRRHGMSKTRLADRLALDGITYEHRKSLGTPPDIRWLYRNRREAEGAQQFREHLEATAGPELDALAAELTDAPATVLLCLEEDPAVCHRREVAEALRRRRPDLEIVDL